VSKDVDAFVTDGLVTYGQNRRGSRWPSKAPIPPNLDPKFATSGFDAGYLTFKPGARGPPVLLGPRSTNPM